LREAGEKNGFNFRIQAAIHIGNGFFVFKIIYITDAAKNKICADFSAASNGQSLVNDGIYFCLYKFPDPASDALP
jgi:hypothetical protein